MPHGSAYVELKRHSNFNNMVDFSRSPFSYTPCTLNKRPFCLDYFELCNFKGVGRKQYMLSTILGRYRYLFVKSSDLDVSL